MKRLLIFILPLLFAACQSSTPKLPPISGPLLATVQAKGTQSYIWDASTHAWRSTGPSAAFTGTTAANLPITGNHVTGPAWLADDGSLVFGRKLADAPAPDSDSIPWLLLEATNHLGLGVLSTTTYIERTQTHGGMPPSSPGADGQKVQVPYSATYTFYGPNTTTQPAN